MKPLRVLYLTETFYPPTVGGLELVAHHLSRQMAERGVIVRVLTRQAEQPAPNLELVGKVAVQRVPPRGRLKGKGWSALVPLALYLLRMFSTLVRQQRNYDIVLVCGLKTLAMPAILAARLTRKPVVIQIAGPAELWEDISGESLQKMKLVSKQRLISLVQAIRNPLLRRADLFISCSAEISAELAKVLNVTETADDGRWTMDNGAGSRPSPVVHRPVARIATIPNGTDTAKFTPTNAGAKTRLREQLGLPANKRLFIFTGRIVATKGLPMLLDVWERVVRKYADIHLVLVGPLTGNFDDCAEQLQAFAAAHGIGDTLTLTGSKTNVVDYLQASDVYVFPSEYEGFSLALTEALACGLPAIATRVGSAEDVITNGENGLLIANKDHGELQAALETLLAQPEQWPRMAAAARRSIEAKFSLATMTDAYLHEFDKHIRSTKVTRQVFEPQINADEHR